MWGTDGVGRVRWGLGMFLSLAERGYSISIQTVAYRLLSTGTEI